MNRSMKTASLLLLISASLPMFGAASSSSAAASSVVARAVGGSAGVRAVQRQKDHIDLSDVSPKVRQVIDYLQKLVTTKKDNSLVAIARDRMQDFADDDLHAAYQAVQTHAKLLPAVSAVVLHQYKQNKIDLALADDKGKEKASDIEDVIDEMSEHAQDAHLWQIELHDDWVTLIHQLTGQTTAWKAELFAQSQTLLDAAGVYAKDIETFKKSLPDTLPVALRNYSHAEVVLLMRALNCAYEKDQQKLKDFVEGLSPEQINWLYKKANEFDVPVLQSVCANCSVKLVECSQELPVELQEELYGCVDTEALNDAMMKLVKIKNLDIKCRDMEFVRSAAYHIARGDILICTNRRVLVYNLIGRKLLDIGGIGHKGEWLPVEYNMEKDTVYRKFIELTGGCVGEQLCSAKYNVAGDRVLITTSNRVLIYSLTDRKLLYSGAIGLDGAWTYEAVSEYNKAVDSALIRTSIGVLIDCWLDKRFFMWLYRKSNRFAEDEVWVSSFGQVLRKPRSFKQRLQLLSIDQLKFLIQKALPSWREGKAHKVLSDESALYISLPEALQRPELFDDALIAVASCVRQNFDVATLCTVL